MGQEPASGSQKGSRQGCENPAGFVHPLTLNIRNNRYDHKIGNKKLLADW